MEARYEREFLALDFAAALTRAESGMVEAVQDHSDYDGRDIHVWYNNNLLVRYGEDYVPMSVQLCGTQARLYPVPEEETYAHD